MRIDDDDVLQHFIKQALAEDVGDGDHTSLSIIPAGKQGKARLLIKDDGVLAGVSVALEVFKQVDPTLVVEILIKDGASVHPGDVAFYVIGNIHAILAAERVVLNIMQRMSGIATATNKIVQMLKNTHTRVLDTRKTTPGMRYLEKLAVKIGGGVNHRFGLYDMILIKDNHIDFAGGVAEAIKASQHYMAEKKLNLPIEIEVRNLDELMEVMKTGGADRILFDNFDFDTLKKAVAIVNKQFITEASGGITLHNAMEYARCGVDYISVGALTHSVKSLDMSLKAIKNN